MEWRSKRTATTMAWRAQISLDHCVGYKLQIFFNKTYWWTPIFLVISLSSLLNGQLLARQFAMLFKSKIQTVPPAASCESQVTQASTGEGRKVTTAAAMGKLQGWLWNKNDDPSKIPVQWLSLEENDTPEWLPDTQDQSEMHWKGLFNVWDYLKCSEALAQCVFHLQEVWSVFTACLLKAPQHTLQYHHLTLFLIISYWV